MASLLLPENAVEVYRGTSRTFALTVTQPTVADPTKTEPVNLTGAVVYMSVKRREEERDYLIQKSSENVLEAEITSAIDGEAKIYLNPADTAKLDAGDYMFDVWVKQASGKRYPVVKPSIFRVLPAVSVLAF